MASKSQIVITVHAARGSSSILISSKGRYVSLPTNGVSIRALQQPIQPTTTLGTYWRSVLNAALTQMASVP